VTVLLEGSFDLSYTSEDNRAVVATDSMKNIVYALAKDHMQQEAEKFALILANHFLDRYSQVSKADVHIEESLWDRMQIDGEPHPHSFTGSSRMKPFARVSCTRDLTRVESGVQDLRILKSTASGFSGFHRDRFTTLPETTERVLATSLTARWLFTEDPASYGRVNPIIVQAMLKAFAQNYSPSVQRTLYQMGESALQAAPSISEIRLSMPNLHCLRVNLEPFGMENKNEIFVPTADPHGLIEATVSRDTKSSNH
jgi:urate oxidase